MMWVDLAVTHGRRGGQNLVTFKIFWSRTGGKLEFLKFFSFLWFSKWRDSLYVAYKTLLFFFMFSQKSFFFLWHKFGFSPPSHPHPPSTPLLARRAKSIPFSRTFFWYRPYINSWGILFPPLDKNVPPCELGGAAVRQNSTVCLTNTESWYFIYTKNYGNVEQTQKFDIIPLFAVHRKNVISTVLRMWLPSNLEQTTKIFATHEQTVKNFAAHEQTWMTMKNNENFKTHIFGAGQSYVGSFFGGERGDSLKGRVLAFPNAGPLFSNLLCPGGKK